MIFRFVHQTATAEAQPEATITDANGDWSKLHVQHAKLLSTRISLENHSASFIYLGLVGIITKIYL